MFLTRREPGVPLSLFRPYPLPFSPPFLLYCSFSICCSFRGGILSVVFPAVAIFFWPAGVPLSLFRPYPLPFSHLFLLSCSLPFLFFYVFFIDLYPGRHSICCFPHWPAGNLECPWLFSDLILLNYIYCSFRGGILSVVFPTVAICFWPAGNLECPCLFSDLILFPFLLLFFYIVPYPSFSSMSFSLIYICCSFRGGILSVVFPAVAICFWPAGNLECPCLFSDLILFPFLLLFFYIVPYPIVPYPSSMSFSLIYICCSFRGGILSAVFPTVAICFWPAGNLECPCLFSDLILFPFLLYCSFSSILFLTLPFLLCLFHCPLPFSPPFLLYCSLPFLFFYVFFMIYICCSFRGGILSVVFPAVAICFWPAGNLECPCLFSDLILFPFLIFFFYIVPYPSFSSMSFSLIYICCSFRGGILSVVFPTVAICFWPAGNLECPWLFSDLILVPFLLLFFYIFFLTLPFLLCFFHWSISAV